VAAEVAESDLEFEEPADGRVVEDALRGASDHLFIFEFSATHAFFEREELPFGLPIGSAVLTRSRAQRSNAGDDTTFPVDGHFTRGGMRLRDRDPARIGGR